MPETRYRMFLGGNPATREELDRVEEIVVEQEIDMAWEARCQIPICVDDQGRWSAEDDPWAETFTRVRIEVQVGEGDFVPLIDGPVVGVETDMSGEPGRSTLTVKVHDDSVYLNRDDAVVTFENLLDHEIAQQIYAGVEQIATTDVDPTAAPNSGLPPLEVQRGTPIQMLRALAQRHDMHAYVLPGDAPGASVGAFKSLPTGPSDLPPLVVLGLDRNVEALDVSDDAQSPVKVEAQIVDVASKTITAATSDFGALESLGAETPFADEAQTGTMTLRPGEDGALDLQAAVNAAAARAAFAFGASGSVLADCYAGVLTPYRVITVLGANARLSGDYVVEKVTHTLSRSQYAQSFSLRRNARSQGSAAGATSLMETIF